MPYIEAKSPTVKRIFEAKTTRTTAKATDMRSGSVYLFTYAGRQINSRRPLILCLGQKTTKDKSTIVEGINLNYLNEVQGRVLDDLDPIFDSVAAEDIVNSLARMGDYKKFPLESIYRTYSVERISSIQEIVM